MIDKYQDWLIAQGFSEVTVAQRVGFARARLLEWGTWDQPPSVLAAWLWQYDQWSRRTYQNHMSSVYKFLLEVGVVESNPVALIRRAPQPPPRPKPLTEAELTLLLSTAHGDLRAWLLLASKAGLRLHEVAKIRGEDLDSFGLTVLGKGGKVARLPLHLSITSLATVYPTSGWWFPSPIRPGEHMGNNAIGARVREHFRVNGIAGGIHRCRHTYGTQLVRAGSPIHVVQSLMRHSSLATTQAYLGVDEDERVAAIAHI